MILRVWAVVLVSLLALPATLEARDAKLYIFGNSLINHLEGGDETTVPYWLAQMAKASGHDFAADGKWGFLRDFVREGEPISNW